MLRLFSNGARTALPLQSTEPAVQYFGCAPRRFFGKNNDEGQILKSTATFSGLPESARLDGGLREFYILNGAGMSK
jgi:hypothetical protein